MKSYDKWVYGGISKLFVMCLFSAVNMIDLALKGTLRHVDTVYSKIS